jgi:hypothetical protein
MLKAIAAGKRKNDRVDARKIADLLRCNMLADVSGPKLASRPALFTPRIRVTVIEGEGTIIRNQSFLISL